MCKRKKQEQRRIASRMAKTKCVCVCVCVYPEMPGSQNLEILAPKGVILRGRDELALNRSSAHSK